MPAVWPGISLRNLERATRKKIDGKETELCPLENNLSKTISQRSVKRLTAIVLTDKKFKGNNKYILNENDKTVTDPCEVAEIFNNYFVSIASEIGPPDPIISADEAISTHQNHPSAIKIREKHSELCNSFYFHAVNPGQIMVHMKQFDIKRQLAMTISPVKLYNWPIRNCPCLLQIW